MLLRIGGLGPVLMALKKLLQIYGLTRGFTYDDPL